LKVFDDIIKRNKKIERMKSVFVILKNNSFKAAFSIKDFVIFLNTIPDDPKKINKPYANKILFKYNLSFLK
jgi:hypothetical protein